MLGLLILATVYWSPTLVAVACKHENLAEIAALNVVSPVFAIDYQLAS
jgi:hypothetical protein